MSVSGSLDWTFAAAGWTVAATGIALLVWALFWDRSRGRRRCPKCWYDMGGVPGLRCPECGREARGERRLRRTRRRWRAAFACVAVLAASIPLVRASTVRAFGVRGLIPTTVLLAGLDWFPEYLIERNKQSPLGGAGERGEGSLAGRIQRSELAAWQGRWLNGWCERRLHRGSLVQLRRALVLGPMSLRDWGRVKNFDTLTDAGAVPRLIEMLAGLNPAERVEAAAILKFMTGRGFSEGRRAVIGESLEGVMKALGDRDDRVVEAACTLAGVAACDPAPVLPMLERIAAERGNPTLFAATWAIYLQADRSEPACRSAESVVRTAPARARASMLSALSLTGVTNRAALPLRDTALIDAVRLALEDADDEVAGQAARALLTLAPTKESFEAVLTSMNRDRTSFVGFLSAIQYSRFHDPRLLPAIIRALEVDARESTIWAVPLLDRFGAQAAAALPALRSIAQDDRFGEQAQYTARGSIRVIERLLERGPGAPDPSGPGR